MLSRNGILPRLFVLVLLGVKLCSGVQPAPAVKAIAAGFAGSVALLSDGTVWEWGSGSAPAPVRVRGLDGVMAVGMHNLAVKNDGTVWAWGDRRTGCGLRQDPTPAPLMGLEGIVAVADGAAHTVALRRDGTVWECVQVIWPAEIAVGELTGVVAIAAGSAHGLALKNDGTVWAWGDNHSGQLGDGTTVDQWSTPVHPVQVRGLSEIVAVAAGGTHNLALKRDGTVWQWGMIPSPYAPPTALLTPEQVPELNGVKTITAGESHSLAIKSDGSVWQWGNTGPPVGSPQVPVQVNGLEHAVAIAGGHHHSLALKSDGTIWAWGLNYSGELGDGIASYQATRVQINGIAGATAVAGGGKHSLTLTRDGAVWAWGNNIFGQLGDGTYTPRATPAAVPGLAGIAAIAAGDFHSLALKGDGTVWAWGLNGGGQLGDGSPPSLLLGQASPVQVRELDDVVKIAAGGSSSAALKRDGTVWMWGATWSGSTLGTPAPMSGLSEIVDIAIAGASGAALRRDGRVFTWGFDLVWPASHPFPAVEVDGLSAVTSVGWGAGNCLAVRADHTVWKWGIPVGGVQSTPTPVASLENVTAVAGGNLNDAWFWLWSNDVPLICPGGCGHHLALKRDGTVWAWGDNYYGQLGDGATAGRMTPAQVAGLSGVTAIAGGTEHSLAVKRDGTVWAWGYNGGGQLGMDPPVARRNQPVRVVAPGSADLAIISRHTGDFPVGADGTYTIEIENIGSMATTGTTTVTDILPPSLSFTSALGNGWNCWALDGVVTCTNSDALNPGDRSTITVTVNATAAALPGVTNFVAVENATDGNPSNNVATDRALVSPGN